MHEMEAEALGLKCLYQLIDLEVLGLGADALPQLLTAAERLGFAPAECLVVEDAPAGVAAGRAAGMRVVAVAGTVPAEELRLADHHIAALTHLQVSALENGQFRVVLRDS